jgi:hypothetical protein
VYLLNGPTLEDEVENGGQIGGRTESHDAVVDVDIDHSSTSYSIQHEGDAQLDEDNRCAVEDLVEKEPLHIVSLLPSPQIHGG